jgi:hypothetical protein
MKTWLAVPETLFLVTSVEKYLSVLHSTSNVQRESI